VLVLDDIHWAEPTLLDLVEYLGEWIDGPVLVLCAARRELIERRSSWGGPTSTGFLVELGPLDTGEVSRLLATLSDEAVNPEVERRIVEQAGGNPLFAEQLLALAREAPNLDLNETPPTVEALLASRLDRLDPRELALLRRASILGRRFTREELADVTPREELGRAPIHLAALADRALVHPREHVFAFHHVLVRDVAYRGIPKAERADLHELAARGAERRDAAAEIVGYHFEQAYRARVDIGRPDEHAHKLASAAGERLGQAGVRAWRRADVHAAVNLLSRALDLSPDTSELACELGIALNVVGQIERAKTVLSNAAKATDDRIGVRAQVELATVLAQSEPNHAAEVLDAAAAALPVLEAAGDDRALGRVWLLDATVRGGFYCQCEAMEQAAMRAVEHYSRAGWSPSTALGCVGYAFFLGPRPVASAIDELERMRGRFEGDRAAEANALLWLGSLEGMRGEIEKGRALVVTAQERYSELGLTAAVSDDCERMLGFVELFDGGLTAAEKHFRASCTHIEREGRTQVLATRAGELAQVLYALGRHDDAQAWTELAEKSSGSDDLDAALAWQPVAGLLEARRGDAQAAERRLCELLDATPDDAVYRRACALLALAEIRRSAGCASEAADAEAAAAELHERKGSVTALRRTPDGALRSP
jgi:tetratricopeptide (TPR) repeat protein